jgi:hypothetical protein
MAGAMVTTMKAPLFSAMIVVVLVQLETSPVVAIAVIVGLLATARLSMTSGMARDQHVKDEQQASPVEAAEASG